MTALGLFPFNGIFPWWWMAVYFGANALLPLAVLATMAMKLMGQRRHLTETFQTRDEAAPVRIAIVVPADYGTGLQLAWLPRATNVSPVPSAFAM
jgi:hypothetical protein